MNEKREPIQRESIKRFSRNVYSQFGEDGIIEEVLKRLPPTVIVEKKVIPGNNWAEAVTLPLTCVEFGGHDGYFCSNTRKLMNEGWTGHMFDIAPRNPDVVKMEITPQTVNLLPPCSVLSIDCDGPDAGIWEAYTGTPDLVIIEINSSLDPDVDFFTPEKGANYSYMKKLGERKDYFLLCHTGNMLFVRNEHKELFPDADETFVRDWLA